MKEIETGSFVSSAEVDAPAVYRVVSWNIARGSELDGVVEFLAAANADIIFLQEADRNARRTGYGNVTKEIAQKLSLNYVFGCEFEELAQGSPSSPAHHGQATLSRCPLSDSSILRFHRQSNFWRPRWFIPTLAPLQRRRGGRMALFSKLQTPDGSLATYNLHCESRGDDSLRYSQLNEFLQHTCSLDVPVIAAGDFNFDLSVGPQAAILADLGFINPFATLRHPTTLSHSHASRDQVIDWIVLRGPFNSTNPQVHSSVVASDHFPLSLSVSFGDAAAKHNSGAVICKDEKVRD